MTLVSSNVPPVPLPKSTFWDTSALPVSKMMQISSEIALLKEEASALPKDDPKREEIAFAIKKLREKRNLAE